MKGDRNYDRPHLLGVGSGDIILLRVRDAVSTLPHVLRTGVVTRCTGARIYYRHPSTAQEEWTLREKVLHVFDDVDEAEAVRQTLTRMAVDHNRRLTDVNNATQDAYEALVASIQAPKGTPAS